MAAAALLARACGPIRGGECAPALHRVTAVRGWPRRWESPRLGLLCRGRAGGAPSESSSDLCPSWVAPRACAVPTCSHPSDSCSDPPTPSSAYRAASASPSPHFTTSGDSGCALPPEAGLELNPRTIGDRRWARHSPPVNLSWPLCKMATIMYYYSNSIRKD